MSTPCDTTGDWSSRWGRREFQAGCIPFAEGGKIAEHRGPRRDRYLPRTPVRGGPATQRQAYHMRDAPPSREFLALRAALADRYVIERELGAGGMATVYAARDLRHGRRVAVKVLHSQLGAMLGAPRFLAEIRMTAQLQHPLIMPMYDSGDAEGGLHFVMPLIEGESLRQRLIREQRLTVEEALRLTQ